MRDYMFGKNPGQAFDFYKSRIEPTKKSRITKQPKVSFFSAVSLFSFYSVILLNDN